MAAGFIHDKLEIKFLILYIAARVSEPLPPEHPLWDCPNLILTPHIAGGLVPLARSRDDNAALFLENLRRYAAGQPLQGQVDPQTGY